jgi:DNA-binding response OmpR family regulator
VEPEVKILIVDDDANNRDLLKTHLMIAGYEVDEASDGEQGAANAQKGAYDLVILDLMMPKKDGWEVCKLLKTSETTKKVPVIMLTARTQPIDELRGFESGADEYITKPVDYTALIETIKKLTKKP